MITILHTADWQIGRVFSQFEPDDAAALFEARFLAVERLASLATQHHVDAILVAGDVFEAQTVTEKTIRRLFNAMAGFTGPWVVIPGNHDAALTESVWTQAQRLHAAPSNVLLCLEPKPVVVAEKFTVLPAPLTQRNTYNDLTDWFSTAPRQDDLPRIGLAHGFVQGILSEGIDSANPIAAGRAEEADLAYLALGDWHGAKRIDDRTWYAGTPEADRFKDNDSGQVLLVSLAGQGAPATVTPVPIGRYTWRQMDWHAAVDAEIDVLVEKLERIASEDVLQVRVAGTCSLTGHRRLADALAAASARARAVVWDTSGLRLEPTEEDMQALHADGFVGEVLQELRAEQTGQANELARDAILALARILDGRRPRAGAGA